MTDRELMQQWLDAIAAIPDDVEGYLPDSLNDLVIATRERLAQPEHDWEAEYTKQVELHNQTLDELRDALAQPEQEPVAWWDGKESVFFPKDDLETINWREYWIYPLYTTSKRQEWLWLSYEDIEKALGIGEFTATSTRITLTQAAKAIEVAVKQKNEGKK